MMITAMSLNGLPGMYPKQTNTIFTWHIFCLTISQRKQLVQNTLATLDYRASASALMEYIGSLIDGGANGGIKGTDMKMLGYNRDGRQVNVGIAGDHQMPGLPLGTYCAVIPSKQGLFLGIFNNYANCL